MKIKIVENGLTTDIYSSLRATADFQTYVKEDVKVAIKNSLFSVVIYDGEKPIGIGRIVGDNRIAFLIKDVVVLPEYRYQNVGKLVMESLLKYIDSKACPNPYVILMASLNTEEFYKKFGFVCRPNESRGAGMFRVY